MQNAACIYSSPVGALRIEYTRDAVCKIEFAGDAKEAPAMPQYELKTQIITQLDEYFSRKRRDFSLPLAPSGTPFQKRVWKALMAIPYGKTRSYQEVAAMIGNEKACRAVGMANHNNPIAIVIPCHRVVGKGGGLTGYAGGLEKKAFLLELEQCEL